MKQKAAGLTISSLILVVLVGAVFIACGRDDAAVESYDQGAPHWVSVFPTDTSIGVPVETSISVTFDEPMSSATIVSFNTSTKECSGGVQLSRDNFFSCVSMAQESYMVSGDKMSFTFSPQEPLDGFTRYKLRITNSAKDLALNRLEGEFEMVDGFETGQGLWPPDNAQGIKFLDQNTNEFEIWGTIEIMRAIDETDITGYALYWGNSPSTKLPGEPPIQTFPVSDPDLSFSLGSMFIPSFATHFLVYSVKGTVEQPTPTSVDIPDTVLRMERNINQDGSNGSDPSYFTVYAGKLFFTASDGSTNFGAELWSYDGMNPPVRVTDIAPGFADSFPQKKVVYNSKLYFQAYDGAETELWEYDDLSQSASNMDIYPGGISSSPGNLTVFNGNLYFKAEGDTNGSELWYLNGGGNGMVEDIYSGPTSSGIEGMTIFQNRLFFSANNGIGTYPWSYDGTLPPPLTTANIDWVTDSVTISSVPIEPDTLFRVYNNRLYFSAEGGTNGIELWYYDGAVSNMAADIFNTPSESSSPSWLTEYNGKLYFSAEDSSSNQELWSYDSVTDSTLMVDDIHPSDSSFPMYLTVYKGMLIFHASNGVDGVQL